MKLKKVAVTGISMAIAFNCISIGFANAKFDDIKNHWASSQIQEFIELGYVKGYEDGTFKPNEKITRAEFIIIVNNVFGFKGTQEIAFKDVNSNNWFYEDVKKAVKAGYIKGYEDQTFRPNDEISRQEIASIITSIKNNKNSNLDKIKKLKDTGSISKWAKSSVEGAIEKNYMSGYKDNTFKPKDSATRAEVVSTLSRVINEVNKKAGTVLIENSNYKLEKYEPREGTYLGAYVLQDELINADMKKFEEITGKKHASYFGYLGYKAGNVDKFKKWMEEVKANGSIPHIALEPNGGLDVVVKDEYLINLAKMFGELDIPIYLRYASEMNGAWVAWNGDPKEYIEKWKLVHDVMEEYAPKVMMVWTPFTTPQNSILKYYPGDKYVDWVGVNVYNVVYHNDRLDQPAMHEDPLELLDYVYDTFSARKPIQISEYGATHYTTTDGKYYVDFAIKKIQRMYKSIWEKYPRIKSIFYFDVNNLVNAPEGRKINNYAITDEPRITKTYKDIVASDNFLDKIKPDEEGKLDKEVFTLADDMVTVGDNRYINLENVKTILGGKITVDGKNVKYSVNGETYTFKNREIGKKKMYVNLDTFAKELGYKIEKRGNTDTLILKEI